VTAQTCDWDVTTAVPARKCGKPAKFLVVAAGGATPNREGCKPVCGTHAQSARAWNYTVEPIGGAS
jgi:hypothetical protein